MNLIGDIFKRLMPVIVGWLALLQTCAFFFYDDDEDRDSDFWNFYFEYIPNYTWYMPYILEEREKEREEREKRYEEEFQAGVEEAKKKVLPELKYLNAKGRKKYFKEYMLKDGNLNIYRNFNILYKVLPEEYKTEITNILNDVKDLYFKEL